jgi:hypothetical protein
MHVEQGEEVRDVSGAAVGARGRCRCRCPLLLFQRLQDRAGYAKPAVGHQPLQDPNLHKHHQVGPAPGPRQQEEFENGAVARAEGRDVLQGQHGHLRPPSVAQQEKHPGSPMHKRGPLAGQPLQSPLADDTHVGVMRGCIGPVQLGEHHKPGRVRGWVRGRPVRTQARGQACQRRVRRPGRCFSTLCIHERAFPHAGATGRHRYGLNALLHEQVAVLGPGCQVAATDLQFQLARVDFVDHALRSGRDREHAHTHVLDDIKGVHQGSMLRALKVEPSQGAPLQVEPHRGGAAVASHARVQACARNDVRWRLEQVWVVAGRRAIVGLDKGRDGRHELVIVQNGLKTTDLVTPVEVHGSNGKKRMQRAVLPQGTGI